MTAGDDPSTAEAGRIPDAGSASGHGPATDRGFATGAGRSADARLARLHLRGGLLALARAELEQMAGAGTLDVPALADLAEVRWRSGDLPGAAEAATAHIEAGGEEPMALLVAAEALDAEGRLIDARAMAARVLERVGGEVERLFAGEPRSSAWSSAGSTLTPLPEGTVPWGALVGGREVAEPDAVAWPPTADVEPDGSPDPAGSDATTGLHGVGEAIDAGMLDGVPERLALLLRRDDELAAVILSAAERALASARLPAGTAAALEIVRGDALRTIGREAEAVDAYERSLRVLAARTHDEEER